MRYHELTEGAGQVLYHATKAANIVDIMKNGLTFFNDSLWVQAGAPGGRYQDDDPSVFAFTHPIDAFRWANKIEWEFDTPAMILKIKDTGHWTPDPSGDITMTMGDEHEKGKAVKSDQPIPASDIVGYLPLTRIPYPKDFEGDQEDYMPFVKDKIINA
jgi:hypothetical protein